MKTRERILRTAFDVFNARRYGNVTLANLAEELGIAKGNIWYHFNDKRALLSAMSDLYLESYHCRSQMVPDPEAVLDSYAAFLKVIAKEIRDFRFLYRDQADYGEHSGNLLEQLPEIYRRTFKQFESFFSALKTAGHMTISSDLIQPLSVNTVIILRYSLEMNRERGLLGDAGSGVVNQTLLQQLTLYEDRLSPGARTYLKTAFSLPDVAISA